jgi:hypothetical protein
MELQPATFAQVQRARNGRMVVVEDDVLDVVRQLQQFDRNLRVRYAENTGHFVVYEQSEDGEKLVLTAQDLDQRVVERVLQISHSSYDYVQELEAGDRQREADREHQFKEQVGEIGERLHHAMAKDLGRTDRAFIPGE